MQSLKDRYPLRRGNPDREPDALPLLRDIVHQPRAYGRLLHGRVQSRLGEPDARWGARGLLGLAVLLVFALFGWIWLILQVPDVNTLGERPVMEATIAYTADGQELTRYHFENRTWVELDEVAPVVVQALVATEDHRFYDHNGVDLLRVGGAVLGTAGGEKQGGSTITMQLARNIFPDIRDDGLLLRKVKEWLTAVRLEDRYTKDEILEMYLNVVPFMYDAAGIEAAARTYFQKSASALTVTESATLIAMLKATVSYNPVRHPERSHQRRNVVLQLMVERGFLEPEVYERVKDEPTKLNFRRLTRHDNLAPFFAEHVRQWLDAWADSSGYNLYKDGLRVYTTLDSRLQRAAEAAIENVMEPMQAVVDVEWSSARLPFFSRDVEDYLEVQDTVEPFAYFWEQNRELLQELIKTSSAYAELRGSGVAPDTAVARLERDPAFLDSLKQALQRLDAGFVAIDPKSGQIRAWVGGRSFKEDEFDHVALARRQPGSTFKPFVYAAALENGFAPYSLVPDAVTTYVDPHTGNRWSPGNFGEVSGRMMTLGQALALSKNTVTARLITTIGPEEVVKVAKKLGIESDLMAVPSLGLGTSEVTLLEMAAAYATIANQGKRRDPIFITRIEDRHGKVLATFSAPEEEAIPPHTAYAVLDMMRGGINYGTAVRMRSLFGARGDLAGKTGTTQHGADGWFMLMHPDLVVGSWMGFSSPSLAFRSTYWGQGAHNALHIVGHFYQETQKLGGGYYSPEAAFPAVTGHAWGNGRMIQVDDLNRLERRSNQLREKLQRIRRIKRSSQESR